MRTIAVVTTSRADYGIYRLLLRRIAADPELILHLLVSGTHLVPEYGQTVRILETDGFVPYDRIEMLLASDSPEAIAQSMGLGTLGFAHSYARSKPDILVILGDRFEMHAAAVAAVPFNVPIAHIHGGELTEGAIDDVFRHAMTKISHLHFVATAEYGRRVIQMGEEPWRVHVTGALGLDALNEVQILDAAELRQRFGLDFTEPTLLVTFHPATLDFERTRWHIGELLAALEICGLNLVFTLPNADTYGRAIAAAIREFCAHHEHATIADNLGSQVYLSMIATAAAMVGNSSSGVIEAPSFRTPVVNVGDRQKGRTHADNIINCSYEREHVADAIFRATRDEFRRSLAGMTNPFASNDPSGKILKILKTIALDQRLLAKKFYQMEHPHDPIA